MYGQTDSRDVTAATVAVTAGTKRTSLPLPSSSSSSQWLTEAQSPLITMSDDNDVDDDKRGGMGQYTGGGGGSGMVGGASSTFASPSSTTTSGSVIGVRSDVDIYSTGLILDAEQNDDDDDTCEAQTYRTVCIPCNACQRCCRTKCSGAALCCDRFCSSKKWQKFPLPAILDLVADRVRSRLLSVLIFLLVMTVVGALIFTAIFKDTPKGGEVVQMDISFLPNGPINFRSTINTPRPIMARLKNSRGYPVTNEVIRIRLDNYLPSSDSQSYCSPYSGSDYGAHLLDLAMADICDPVFTGDITTTDDDGVAYFSDFSILSGAPGLYSFNFSCASATCSQKTDDKLSQVVNIAVISSVNSLVLTNMNATKWDGSFTVGQPLSFQPIFRVLDANGAPLANRRVVAHTYGPMRYVQGIFSLPVIPIARDINRAMDMDKVGILSNHIVISDNDGYARFTALTVTGYNNPNLIFGFYCEGVRQLLLKPTSKWATSNVEFVPIPVSTGIASTIASATLREPLPVNMTEGPSGGISAHVIVKNAAGTPLSGRYCFAKVVAIDGVTFPYIQSQVLDVDTKTLENPISSSSGSDGVATFTNLYFGWVGRNGHYSVQFICEDAMTVTSVIYVRSKVHAVTLIEPVAWAEEIRTGGGQSFQLPSGAIATSKRDMPIFVILDIDGNPVPGRRIKVTDLSGHSDIRITSDLSDENGIVYVLTFQIMLRLNDTQLPCYQSDTQEGCYNCSSTNVILGVTVDADVQPVLTGAPAMTVANPWRYMSCVFQYQLAEATGAMPTRETVESYIPATVGRIEFVDPPRAISNTFEPYVVRARLYNGFGKPAGEGITVCARGRWVYGDPAIFLYTNQLAFDVNRCVTTTNDSIATFDSFSSVGFNTRLGLQLYTINKAPSVKDGVPYQLYIGNLAFWANETTSEEVIVEVHSGATKMVEVVPPPLQVDIGQPISWMVRKIPDPVLVYPPTAVLLMLDYPVRATYLDAFLQNAWNPIPPTITQVDQFEGRLLLSLGNLTGHMTIDFLPAYGSAGNYTLLLFDATDRIMGTTYQITVRNPVASLQLYAWWNSSMAVLLDRAFPVQPAVRVLDTNGNPLEGFRINAVLTGASATYGALVGQTSVDSDSNGIARFTDLALLAGVSGVAYQIELRYYVDTLFGQSFTTDVPLEPLYVHPASAPELSTLNNPPLVISYSAKLNTPLRVAYQPLFTGTFVPPTNVSIATTSPVPMTVDCYAWDPIGLGILPSGRPLLEGISTIPVRESIIDSSYFGTNEPQNVMVATFDQLRFVSGNTGLFILRFSFMGLATIESRPFILGQDVASVEIITQPDSFQVGGLSIARVRATSRDGSGMKNIAIATIIASGAGVLDPASGTNFTDENGYSDITIRMRDGTPGEFSFYFQANDATKSQPSTKVMVYNPVATVTFTTQPSGSVRVLGDSDDSIATMVQPVVRILDHRLHAVAGSVVTMAAATPDGSVINNLISTARRTDGNGYAYFNDVHFNDDISDGTYTLIASCLGVKSNMSAVIGVTNKVKIDTSTLSGFRDGIYACAALLIPLFLGNSTSHSYIWMWAGLVVSVIYLIVGLIWNITNLMAQGTGSLDPFTFIIRFLSIINFVAVTASFIYVVISYYLHQKEPNRPHKYFVTYDQGRRDNYRVLVQRLLLKSVLPPPATTKASTKDAPKDDSSDRKELVSSKRDLLTSSNDDELPTSDDIPSTGSPRAASGTGKKNFKKPKLVVKEAENASSKQAAIEAEMVPYMGPGTFYYPQRLLFAFYLTLVLAFFSLLGASVLLKYLMAFVSKARVYTLDLQFSLNRVRPYVDLAQSANNAALLFGVDISTYIGGTGNKALSIMSFIWDNLPEINGALVNGVAKRILAAGIIGALCGYLFVCTSWFLILSSYRSDIYRLRRGEASRLILDRPSLQTYSYATAGTMPGTVIWRCVIAFASIFVIVTIVMFALMWKYVWAGIGYFAYKILLGLSIVYICVQVLFFALGRITVRPNWIRYRRVFMLYDVCILFMGFASGLIAALKQFLIALGTLFLTFPRIDVRNFPKDAAFDAYVAMLRLDHEYSNPVGMIATDALVDDARAYRQQLSGEKQKQIQNDMELHSVSSSADIGTAGSINGGDNSIGGRRKTVAERAAEVQNRERLPARADQVTARMARNRLRCLYTLVNNDAFNSATSEYGVGARKGDRPTILAQPRPSVTPVSFMAPFLPPAVVPVPAAAAPPSTSTTSVLTPVQAEKLATVATIVDDHASSSPPPAVVDEPSSQPNATE